MVFVVIDMEWGRVFLCGTCAGVAVMVEYSTIIEVCVIWYSLLKIVKVSGWMYV
jgi:hypothetical protein